MTFFFRSPESAKQEDSGNIGSGRRINANHFPAQTEGQLFEHLREICLISNLW